jgi:hypothetical protein
MRTIFKITLLLFAPAALFAGEGLKGKYLKEKKISKTFNVSATAALDVSNKYGTVYVTTWDQNQTVIDVVIKVSGNNEGHLEKRLNSIDVNFNATTAKVTAETKIGNYAGKASMEINYTIKVPKKGSIDVNNQYGNIILGKIYGRTMLKLQYGNLSADQLNGNKNELNLQYTDVATIDHIALGKITVQYSSLKIQNAADELTLNSEYTDVKLGAVKRLNLKTAYGDIKVDNVQDVAGTASYSDVRIGTLTGMLNYSTTYGDIVVGRISKDVSSVFISGQYSDINIKYDAAWAFDFSAKTLYADVRGAQNFTLQEKKETGSSRYYRGYHRSSGTGRLTIESDYGDINLTRL